MNDPHLFSIRWLEQHEPQKGTDNFGMDMDVDNVESEEEPGIEVLLGDDLSDASDDTEYDPDADLIDMDLSEEEEDGEDEDEEENVLPTDKTKGNKPPLQQINRGIMSNKNKEDNDTPDADVDIEEESEKEGGLAELLRDDLSDLSFDEEYDPDEDEIDSDLSEEEEDGDEEEEEEEEMPPSKKRRIHELGEENGESELKSKTNGHVTVGDNEK